MRNLLILMAILLLISCQKDSYTEFTDAQIDFRKPDKVNVCHFSKGEGIYQILSISRRAWPAHEAHGDVIDSDGDGYFAAENGCNLPVDCNEYDPEIFECVYYSAWVLHSIEMYGTYGSSDHPGYTEFPNILLSEEPDTIDQHYPVAGNDRDEIGRDMFNGREHAAETRADLGFNYRTARNADGTLTVTITEFTINTTVFLPQWTPPADADPDLVAEWNRFYNELVQHERGHETIYQQGEAAIRNHFSTRTFVIPGNLTPEEMDNRVMQEIQNSQPYQDMQNRQEAYDAPYDEDTNPTGTNHGTENGQDAVWDYDE